MSFLSIKKKQLKSKRWSQAPKPIPIPKSYESEPEYETIEDPNSNNGNENTICKKDAFCNQPKPIDDSNRKCIYCDNETLADIICIECDNLSYCEKCDYMFHKHSKRAHHKKKIKLNEFRTPALPKKPQSQPPLPPPRRHKQKLNVIKENTLKKQIVTPCTKLVPLSQNGPLSLTKKLGAFLQSKSATLSRRTPSMNSVNTNNHLNASFLDWRKNIQPNHRYRSQLVLNQNEINRFENNQFQAFQKNQSKPISNSCSVMDLSQQSVPNFMNGFTANPWMVSARFQYPGMPWQQQQQPNCFMHSCCGSVASMLNECGVKSYPHPNPNPNQNPNLSNWHLPNSNSISISNKSSKKRSQCISKSSSSLSSIEEFECDFDSNKKRNGQMKTSDSSFSSYKTKPFENSSSSCDEYFAGDRWKCKHCTFVNKKTNKICQMCCKTNFDIGKKNQGSASAASRLKSNTDNSNLKRLSSKSSLSSVNSANRKSVTMRKRSSSNMDLCDRKQTETKLDTNEISKIVDNLINLKLSQLQINNNKQVSNKVDFTENELKIAKSLMDSKCADTEAIEWLNTHWNSMISNVRYLTSKHIDELKQENVILEPVTFQDAKDMLIQENGNIWSAVNECIKIRTEKSRSAVNDWLNGRGLSETNAMNNSVDVRLESCGGANLTDESFSNREQPARSVRPPTNNPKKNADFYEDNLSESFAFMFSGESTALKTNTNVEQAVSPDYDNDNKYKQRNKGINKFSNNSYKNYNNGNNNINNNNNQLRSNSARFTNNGTVGFLNPRPHNVLFSYGNGTRNAAPATATATSSALSYSDHSISDNNQKHNYNLRSSNGYFTLGGTVGYGNSNRYAAPTAATSSGLNCPDRPISDNNRNNYNRNNNQSANVNRKYTNRRQRKKQQKMQPKNAPMNNDHNDQNNRKARKLLAEKQVITFEEALAIVDLTEKEVFNQNEALEVVTGRKFTKECQICSIGYKMDDMESMMYCIHECCKSCTKQYFTLQIKEKSLNNCVCPICQEPKWLSEGCVTGSDDVTNYFSFLDIFLKRIVDPEVHDLFQVKLRDYSLSKEKNFKWCPKCSFGYFVDNISNKGYAVCEGCGFICCIQCNLPWKSQHLNISCSAYKQWLTDNDDSNQKYGVDEYLKKNGIKCPKCKFQFSLARGGCIHFTCSQCKYEFCYGCEKPFFDGIKCGKTQYCGKLGLHAHHPRNCLFYLRDKEPADLQKLLILNKIDFTSYVDSPGKSCPLQIQKENGLSQFIDEKCNADIESNQHAGFCRQHYVEYLCKLIQKNQLESLEILSIEDFENLVLRAGKRLPVNAYGTPRDMKHYIEYLVDLINQYEIDCVPIMDSVDLESEIRRNNLSLPKKTNNYVEDCRKIVSKIPLV